jgi:GNAT superfamily N-acetyltransferase
MLLGAMASDLQIRVLTEQDAQALWDLRLIALQTDPWSFVDSPEEHRAITLDVFASRLKSNDKANFVVGAFAAGALVGMTGFYQEQPQKRRHKGWVWGVFVHPDARGRGIAKMLMLEVIRRAKAIEEVDMLLLTVGVGQPAPWALYTSVGFRSFGTEPAGLKIGAEARDEENMVLEFEKER